PPTTAPLSVAPHGGPFRRRTLMQPKQLLATRSAHHPTKRRSYRRRWRRLRLDPSLRPRCARSGRLPRELTFAFEGYADLGGRSPNRPVPRTSECPCLRRVGRSESR